MNEEERVNRIGKIISIVTGVIIVALWLWADLAGVIGGSNDNGNMFFNCAWWFWALMIVLWLVLSEGVFYWNFKIYKRKYLADKTSTFFVCALLILCASFIGMFGIYLIYMLLGGLVLYLFIRIVGYLNNLIIKRIKKGKR